MRLLAVISRAAAVVNTCRVLLIVKTPHRATARVRPYYTINQSAKAVYSRGAPSRSPCRGRLGKSQVPGTLPIDSLNCSPIFPPIPFGTIDVFSAVSTPTPGYKIKHDKRD